MIRIIINVLQGGHTPLSPDRIQDLYLESASYDEVTGFTFVTLSRALDTGDVRDDVVIEVVFKATSFYGSILNDFYNLYNLYSTEGR